MDYRELRLFAEDFVKENLVLGTVHIRHKVFNSNVVLSLLSEFNKDASEAGVFGVKA